MKDYCTLLLILSLVAIGFTGCDNLTGVIGDSYKTPMDEQEAFTIAFVQEAIDLYKTQGRDTAIAHYNDPQNIDRQWYVFITDENGFYVANAFAPYLIGANIKNAPGIDGLYSGVDIAKATAEGRWTEYIWPNPETNKIEQKRTWSIRYDGYLFASGYYEPWAPDPASFLPARGDDSEAYTRSLVLSAIARYERDGSTATAAYYNDPARIDGEWYVFITDENDIFVSHPVRQDFVANQTGLKDLVCCDGYQLGIEIAKATGTGLWVNYLWHTKWFYQEVKHTWAIRHDGYLFGSGFSAILGNGILID